MANMGIINFVRNLIFKHGNQEYARLDERGFWGNHLHSQWYENFQQLPDVNASIAITTNINFETLGTGTEVVTFAAGGGITCTTGGNSGDQCIILPHLDTNQTSWAKASNFLSQKSPRFEAWIRTGASVASVCFWAGFKLTNTDVLATDADAVFFKFTTTADSGGSATNLTVCTARGGTKIVTVLPIAIAASTTYRLRIDINAARQPRVQVGRLLAPLDSSGTALTSNVLEAQMKTFDLTLNEGQTGADGSAALTTAIDFIPYVGVKTLTGAAKAIDLIELRAGRLVA